MISCGHCGEKHQTVDEVRACPGTLPWEAAGEGAASTVYRVGERSYATAAEAWRAGDEQRVQRSISSAPRRTGAPPPSAAQFHYESFSCKRNLWSDRPLERKLKKLEDGYAHDDPFKGLLRVVGSLLATSYEQLVVEDLLPSFQESGYSVGEMCDQIDACWKGWYHRQLAWATVVDSWDCEVEDLAIWWFVDPEEDRWSAETKQHLPHILNFAVRPAVLKWGLGDIVADLIHEQFGNRPLYPPVSR